MADSSFYSDTGTTSASISSINTLSNAATASKDAAAASATAAAASATTASGHKDTATTQAALATTNGADQVALATTQANNAAASATTASGHKDTATTQAALATTNGAAQVTLATAQVALATTQAGNAATSATAAAGSATTASGHKDTATTQAALATTNGAAQVTLATAQVALATTQAGNAATSATAAATSAADAAASLDLFTDQYLGAHSSDPTADGDGDSLTVGDLYYNSTSGNMKYYNGSAWVSAFVSASGMAALSGSTFTGNVTVPNLITAGNVDGRDVSVDGTKLDGIAASANNYVHPNHSGEVTSTADGATVVADNIIDEANLKVSNSPTNGYALTAQSGNTGGLTWAATADTTYSVGDGGLTEINFTSADNTKLDGIATGATNFTSANAISAVTGSNLDMGSNNVTTTGKMLFANMYSQTGDLPSASTYHGMFAHVHGTGLAYYAHGGNWISLAKTSELASVGDGGLTTNDFTDADHSKLNGIEASADVTDVTNVTAAGALMDSEVTNLAQVKAFSSSDYATAAQGTLATNALPKSGGTMTGVITADAGIDIDNINIDGTTIGLSSGNLTLDVAGEINIDAGGGNITILDDGTGIAYLANSASNFVIQSAVSDKDLLFKGNDGGSTITALTLDMSAAGAATFNNDVTAFSDERLKSNITTIPDALSKVSEMRGVHYVRNETGKDSSGVIAQELQKIAPELVLTADDEMGTMSVNYGNITGYLIEAIKELKAEIEELKAR
jgi:hypothetical protein